MPRDLGTTAEDTFTVRETDLDLTGDLDETITYTLRPLSFAKLTQIRKTHTRVVKRMERMDDWGMHADALDEALVSWEGYELNGEPCPCTRDWKLKLPGPIQNALVELAINRLGPAVPRDESFRQPA